MKTIAHEVIRKCIFGFICLFLGSTNSLTGTLMLIDVRPERLLVLLVEIFEVSLTFEEFYHCLFDISEGEELFDTHFNCY